MRTPPVGAFAFQQFDTKVVAPFYECSTSKETRRAYRRLVKEFFAFLDNKPDGCDGIGRAVLARPSHS